MAFEKFSPKPEATATRKRTRKAPTLPIADELAAEITAIAERWDTTAKRIAAEALRIGLEAIARRSEAYNRRAFAQTEDGEE